MLYSVIMAGGSGTRLWPESRRERPKQLLRIQDHRTMLEATIDRVSELVSPGNLIIATTDQLAALILKELPQLSPEMILTEPMPRNTAPCIGLAAVRVIREEPDATMLILPSDHVIEPTDVFCDAIRLGEQLIEEDPQRLVTFGIRPTYPSTSFGYIERAELLDSVSLDDHPTLSTAAHRVQRFREKPGYETAQEYVASGRYSWNAGIFMWKAQTILDLLQEFEPSIYAHLMAIAGALEQPDHEEVLAREFAAMKNISIDYAVMERANEVVTIEAPFHWDDVGGWRSLERLRPTDENGNLLDSQRCIALQTKDTIVRSCNPDRVVALLGVRDLIVVETDDAILIANKNDEESVRNVIAELTARGWEEYL